MRCIISYSRDSRNAVEHLASDLRILGHEVWYDQSLTGGQKWWDEIISKIKQCDLFIFALTPKGLESQACKLEYDYAYAINKRVLPVWLEGEISPKLLPSALSMIQYVDYRGEDKGAAFELAKALQNLPPAQPIPDPLPDPPPPPISYLVDLSERIVSEEPLTFQDQTEITFRLKSGLQSDEDRDDVLTLLRKLRNRDDLFAKVGAEIDEILKEYGGQEGSIADKMPAGGASRQPAQKKIKQTADAGSAAKDQTSSKVGSSKKGQITGLTIGIIVLVVIALCGGCLLVYMLDQALVY